MPAGFERCVAQGGRVKRFSGPRPAKPKLAADQYVNICWLNGKSYFGDVKKKKSTPAAEHAYEKAAAKHGIKV